MYECTLCETKTTRKDNIRRHVRNLHANEDINIDKILENIFTNFSKQFIDKGEKKTEQNSIYSNDDATIARNGLTSVIKFIGKSEEKSNIDATKMNSEIDRKIREKEVQSSYTFTKSIYKPLTLEPIPSVEPTPLVIKSNLNVYHELLSPYLKRNSLSNSKQMKSFSKDLVKPMNSASVIVAGPSKNEFNQN